MSALAQLSEKVAWITVISRTCKICMRVTKHHKGYKYEKVEGSDNQKQITVVSCVACDEETSIGG